MKDLIPAEEFCAKHNIDFSLIRSLHETGLIEITIIEETGYIQAAQLKELEKIVRLYYELDINLEGIDTITNLLQRMHAMQDEITSLKNRLRFYESDEL